MDDYTSSTYHRSPTVEIGVTAATAAAASGAGRSRNRSALHWMASAVAVLLALLLGLLTLLMIGFETGAVAFISGFVIATLPVPLYIMLVLWLDRYESEPFWMLATAFFWGALVAVFFAILINSISYEVVEALAGEKTAELYGKSVSAPVVEEVWKALALFALFFWKRDEFDGVIDGIVYAGMVGLGFAMTENMLYYGRAVVEGQTLTVFVLRGMFAPYAHPLFTSMTGIGLGLASQRRRGFARVALPLAGLLLATALHSVWNTSLYLSERYDDGRIALAMYFLLMFPIFTGVLAAVRFALQREGRILREHLHADQALGILTPDEYAQVCTIRGRIGSSFSALMNRGFRAWRLRVRFHLTASELAFHRSRIARGLSAGTEEDAERERYYRGLLVELRNRLEAHRSALR